MACLNSSWLNLLAHKASSPKDFFDNDLYAMNKILLYSIGNYPYQPGTRHLYTICVLFSIASLMAPQLVKFSEYIQEQEVDNVIICLPPLMVNTLTLVKIFNVIANRKKMKYLFDAVKMHWDNTNVRDELDILQAYTQKGTDITNFYVKYIIWVMIMYVSLPMVPLFLDVILPLNQSRELHTLYEVDYGVNNDDYFFPIYFHSVISTCSTVQIILAVDSMYMLLVHHGCGLFAQLGHRIKTVHDSMRKHEDGWQILDNPRDYRELEKCVIKHQQVLNYAERLADSTKTSYLLQVGINMVTISFTGVQTIMYIDQPEQATRFATFVLAQNVHLFFNSWPGQKLTDYSLNLQNSIYEAQWFRMPVRMRKLLLIMQMRSMKPCKMSAGGLYDMSLENFGQVVKTAMSYFTVLLSCRE